ncbi:MAG: DUF2203 family protein [Armatimonadota bacterium]|nr:DUF2203 family protein [Armatimonadota bacterium]MDR7533449.1 DUF2203 family protein [Armatimonadota bacterium]
MSEPRPGEPAVAFWHGLTAGYAGRQPIALLADRRPSA